MSVERVFQVQFTRRAHGRMQIHEGPPVVPDPIGREPARVARLLALAHRVEALVAAGEVKDYAEVALVGGITRARMSQITGLLFLAPDIQESVLSMERPPKGRELIGEQHLRPIALELDWKKQRAAFAALVESKANRIRKDA